MSWNLEGMNVAGLYMGSFPVAGRVESSRVKYGGGVEHTVVLSEPLSMPWRSEPATRVLLEHKFVTTVSDN